MLSSALALTPGTLPPCSFLLQLGQLDVGFSVLPPTQQALAAQLLACETFGYSSAWSDVLHGRCCFRLSQLQPVMQQLQQLQATLPGEFLRPLWQYHLGICK
jgi:hypothetical protein